MVDPSNFEKTTEMLIDIPILGTVLGILWNITGIFRNQRLVWHRLLTQYDIPDKKADIAKKNFHLYALNILCNLISVFLIILLLARIVTNLQKTLVQEKSFINILSNYGVLVITFLSILGYYIRMLFKNIYSKKDREQRIYPSLVTILNIESTSRKK